MRSSNYGITGVIYHSLTHSQYNDLMFQEPEHENKHLFRKMVPLTNRGKGLLDVKAPTLTIRVGNKPCLYLTAWGNHGMVVVSSILELKEKSSPMAQSYCHGRMSLALRAVVACRRRFFCQLTLGYGLYLFPKKYSHGG